MHHGRAIDTVKRPVNRGDAELVRLLRVGLHVRLVNLDDVGAGGFQLSDLFVQCVGISHYQAFLVAVILV